MRRYAPWLIVPVGAVLAIVAYLVLDSSEEPRPEAAPTETVTDEASRDTTRAQPDPSRGTEDESPEVRPGIPARIEIPKLKVSAPVRRIGMSTDPDDPKYRTLVPPSDPMTIGWWKDGPQPGADRGSALLLGHTKKVPGMVGVGEGAFGYLSRLVEGDTIELVTDAGPLRYEVTEVQADVDWAKVAQQAAEIDDRDYPGGRLVLITCWYDGNRFTGNTFVFAEPVRGADTE